MWPSWPRVTARLAATVDLPTPPLPEATATTWRTSGIKEESWAIAFCAASSRLAGRVTFISTLTSRVSGMARTARSTSSLTFSAAAGFWVAITSSTTAEPAQAFTRWTKPKETMSRLIPGNFTPFKASQTAAS